MARLDRRPQPRRLGQVKPEAGAQQIDQLLANLCVNARDAIDGVGQIAIETDTVAVPVCPAAGV